MRFLSTTLAAVSLAAFAIAPANACPWSKTSEVKTDMTVAEAVPGSQDDTDVSIATNDLSDDLVLQPVPAEKPTE